MQKNTIQNPVMELYPDQIRVIKGLNPRIDKGDMKSLQANIEQNGIKVAVKVRKVKGEKTDDDYQIYELITGHRRYACAVALTDKAGEAFMVPAVELDANISKADMLLEILATDQDQKPFTIYEQALNIKALKDEGMKPSEIARKAGKSQTHVSDCLLLIEKGTKEIIQQVRSGSLAASAAIAMLKEGTADEVDEAVTKAAAKAKLQGKNKISVSKVEQEAGKKMTKKSKGAASASNKKGADEVSGKKTPAEGRNSAAIGELEGVMEALEAQKKDCDTIPGSFEVLRGVIDLLKGKIDPIDMVGLFLVKKQAKSASANKSTAPKKSAKPADEDEDLEEDEEDSKPKSLGQRLKEAAAEEDEAPKKSAKKPAPAAPKKSAAKKAPDPVEDDDEDDLEDADVEDDDDDFDDED